MRGFSLYSEDLLNSKGILVYSVYIILYIIYHYYCGNFFVVILIIMQEFHIITVNRWLIIIIHLIGFFIGITAVIVGEF